MESLELVLHPTAEFCALDEDVAASLVHVHNELFQVAMMQPD